MPICFRAQADDPVGPLLEGEVLDLSHEFDQESIERLLALKSWAEDADHVVKVVTHSPFADGPPDDHTLLLGEIFVYYAIEAHERGSISKTFHHLCVSHIERPLELEDRRVTLLVSFFFPHQPPTEIRRCRPNRIHFFKDFERVH